MSPLQLLLPTAADTPSRLFEVARSLHHALRHGETPTRQGLKRWMVEIFGGDDAGGAWSMRDAYDALETAQALMLADTDCPWLDGASPAAILDRLRHVERALPTQTCRSERQVDLQQFSTPLRLSWLAALAADPRAQDVVLEPSAGTGMLAAHARRAGARVHLNERDPQRADLLALALGSPVSRHDGEHIADCLDPGVEPTLILINPPFSRSVGRGADRHAGARHLRSGLLRLAPGGRCVAILAPNFAADGSAALGYHAVAEVVPPRAEITILGSPYAKHGTSIDVRLLVYDKGWSGSPECHTAESIDAALGRILALPPRLDPSAPPSAPRPVAMPRPRPAPGPSPAALFAGLAKAPIVAPSRIAAGDEEAAPLAYRLLDEPLPPGEAAGIYAPWRLSRIAIDGVKPHPDALVESLAMASIAPPVPRYRPLLQGRAVDALSDAQLETVILAGDAFERDLPGRFRPNDAGDRLREDADGGRYRTGFFIGDGTGVGKGREVAACIRDRWNRGHRRAIWVSKSAALIDDARRDHVALGGLGIDIQPLDAFPLGQPIVMESGIVFLTYAMLRSARHDHLSRLQQLVRWASTDFEGMLVFDEAHEMGNAAGTANDYGVTRGSEQGIAGVRLQNALPRACVLYVSATGATRPDNLSYASRLGLWGPGTAFGDREAFLAAMEEGGIAAAEIVARDLKAMGLYTARALSFAGVEYEAVTHTLTPDQITVYDSFADCWGIVHREIDAVLKASNIVDRMSGATLNAQAKGAALSRFESSKQRFWSLLLIAMKMPSLIRAIEAELAHGHAAVVQLVSTAEAILDRRLAGMSPEERAGLSIELSPLQILVDYLHNAFPVRQMRVFRASDGSDRSEPMVDEKGRPVLCQEAIARRDELIEQICGMTPVPAALDSLIAHFGVERVAEVTGRSRRLVVDARGQQKVDRRGARANHNDVSAFQDGRKPVLVFSAAGGTGRSYHADRASKSAHKRRIHFLLEPGWRADVAIQGLGRSHRTNQAMPPVFRPVVTDCKGERRFISTIARRLDTLGALTRGQRQTGGQNLFDPADNFESDHAREALTQWYHLLQGRKLASVTLDAFQAMAGLKLVDDQGLLLDRLPPIQRWLNRILSLRIATQNAIFDEYLGLIQARVDAAREAGTLDIGVETIRAERIVTLDDQMLREDPVTGAATRLLHLELHRKPYVTTFARLMRIWRESDEKIHLRNRRSGRIALRVPSWSITDEEGKVVPMVEMIRPTGSTRSDLAALARGHWQEIAPQEFEALWKAEAEEALARVEIEKVHVATGLLLPVWHKLPQHDVRVWRIDDGTSRSILGRIIWPEAIDDLRSEFGLTACGHLDAADLIRGANATNGVKLPGMHGATLKTVTVNGSRRLEIRNYRSEDRMRLKACGAFSEVIAYKTRLFVPVDRAETVLKTMMEDR